MDRELLAELYGDELLFLDPPERFDACIAGIVSRSGTPASVVYDRRKVINALIEDGMDEDEAYEYFDFNIADAYVGEHTPFFLETLE